PSATRRSSPCTRTTPRSSRSSSIWATRRRARPSARSGPWPRCRCCATRRAVARWRNRPSSSNSWTRTMEARRAFCPQMRIGPGRRGCGTASRHPVNARWLIYHARTMRGEQLLQIVRMLDKQMNNTSVILLFQIGKKKLLFPGDAQFENWQYALGQKKYRSLLASVNLYKVGHHGSLNATPKSLWKLFKNKSDNKRRPNRLLSLM